MRRAVSVDPAARAHGRIRLRYQPFDRVEKTQRSPPRRPCSSPPRHAPRSCCPARCTSRRTGTSTGSATGSSPTCTFPTTAGSWMQPAYVPRSQDIVAVLRAAEYSNLYLLNSQGQIIRRLSNNANVHLDTVYLNHWMFYPHMGADGTLYFSYDQPKNSGELRGRLLGLVGIAQRQARRQAAHQLQPVHRRRCESDPAGDGRSPLLEVRDRQRQRVLGDRDSGQAARPSRRAHHAGTGLWSAGGVARRNHGSRWSASAAPACRAPASRSPP